MLHLQLVTLPLCAHTCSMTFTQSDSQCVPSLQTCLIWHRYLQLDEDYEDETVLVDLGCVVLMATWQAALGTFHDQFSFQGEAQPSGHRRPFTISDLNQRLADSADEMTRKVFQVAFESRPCEDHAT